MILGEQSQVQGGIRGGVAGEIYNADEDGDFFVEEGKTSEDGVGKSHQGLGGRTR